MLRQYRAPHHRPVEIGGKIRPVGTIAIGTIVYIQNAHRPFEPLLPHHIARRTPWIVEAWHPREVSAARRAGGKYVSTYQTGGHLATVRSLRDGRRRQIADWILQQCVDSGLEKHSSTTPP